VEVVVVVMLIMIMVTTFCTFLLLCSVLQNKRILNIKWVIIGLIAAAAAVYTVSSITLLYKREQEHCLNDSQHRILPRSYLWITYSVVVSGNQIICRNTNLNSNPNPNVILTLTIARLIRRRPWFRLYLWHGAIDVTQLLHKTSRLSCNEHLWVFL